MKKGMLTGWTKVFGFTFRQHARTKGYLIATILVTVLMLALIPAGMLLIEKLTPSAEEAALAAEHTEITGVYIVDEIEGSADYSLLNVPGSVYGGISYTIAESVPAAAADAGKTDLILALGANEGEYRCDVLIPEGSEIERGDAEGYGAFASGLFRYILTQKSGADPMALSMTSAPVYTQVEAVEREDALPGGLAGEVVSMVLPYVMIMLMYFLVLGYGQSVANSVITEKTSKLMDLFLVSIKPAAMMLGKLLAIALTGMIQITCWLGGIAGGFALGTWLVRMVNPDTTMGIILFFDLMGTIGDLFTPGGIAIAVALLAGGFLLYCSLSSFGGALAGKPEDLSTTNMLFTTCLIISFFAAIYGGAAANGGMVSNAEWLNYVPFTAILVTPGRAMLGQVSLATGLISLGIVMATAFVITLLSGKTYSMMAFWRGNPPKPTQVFRIFKERAKKA